MCPEVAETHKTEFLLWSALMAQPSSETLCGHQVPPAGSCRHLGMALWNLPWFIPGTQASSWFIAGAGLGRVRKQWIQRGKPELGREEMGVGVCLA